MARPSLHVTFQRPYAVAELDLIAKYFKVLSDPTRGSANAANCRSHLQRDQQGRVVAFSGLSLRPTAHRFEILVPPLHTWCAWDTCSRAIATVTRLCALPRSRRRVSRRCRRCCARHAICRT
jgi:hypothetical protein